MPFLYYNKSYNKKAINLTIQIRINLNHKYLIKKMPPLVMSKDDEDKKDIDGNIKLATKPKTKTPPLYRVLMMNDDYTPMEFVIEVLEKFFQKNREEATQIMLHVHQRGVGVCGIYAYDLAETKAMQVMNYARKYEHPLQVQLEKE